MAQVYFKDRDGLTRGFEIAGDQPTASEQARISAVLNGETPQTNTPAPESQTGILGMVGQGVGAGWNQMQAGAMGLAGLAAKNNPEGKFLGYTPEQYEKFRQEQNNEAATYETPEGGFGDQEGAYDTTRYLAYQLGQSIPATAGGLAGSVVGTAMAPGIGTVGGFMVGAGLAGLASLPQSYNENIETQIATHGKIKDSGKAFEAALLQSGIEGVADRALLGFSGVLKGIVPSPVKNMVRDATKSALLKAGKKVGENTIAGVGTEAVTEAVQQALTRWQAEKPLGDEEAQKEYLENAIVGGLLGGAMGGALGTTGAIVDAHETRKYDQIKKDLAEQDNFGDVEANIEGNRKARLGQAAAALDMEEKLSGPSVPLLQDLRSEAVGLTGPKTVERKAAPTPEVVTPEAPAFGDLPASNDNFTTEEYVKAVDAMRNEKLVSADKIKNTMKIGRKKADAIFETMLGRLDAKPAGSKGQYLTVVDKSSSGNVTEEPSSITRRYEVRPTAQEDVAPYRVVRQGGKPVGPAFKNSEDAHSFADTQKLGDYAVIEEPSAKSYSVYEVTSGVEGQKPVSRFVRSYGTDAEARDYANSLNPQFSPDTNQAVAENGRVLAVKQKAQQMFGQYQTNVQALADKMLGKGRSVVDLVETITAPTGEGLKTGNIIEGSTMIADGLRRIQIASGINNPNLSPDEFQKAINSVAHHEVLHVAKEAGLFTPAEWKNLVRRTSTRVAGKNYTYLERAQVRTQGAPSGANLEEEAVAEMVRDYMRDPTKFESAPRSLLRRLLDFVRTFGQYAGDIARGNQTLSDFSEGKLSDRPTDTSRAALYGPYYSSVQIPGFYLKSAKYFEDIAKKTPNLAYPGQQWVGMISPQKTGIKAEELEWLGLNDWLKGQDKVPVKDILQYIAANSVDIKEAVSGSWNKVRNEEADFAPVHGHITQAGGEDYTEMIFHMPHLSPSFSEPFHFDGMPNILAFGRFNTRYLDGKKVLFIEELQSDLHQQGRKQGYTSKSDEEYFQKLKTEFDETNAALYQVGYRNANNSWAEMSFEDQREMTELQKRRRAIEEEIDDLAKVMTIPNAPLKTGWHEFVVKRLVRHAAENGFDAISWNGEPLGALTEQYIRKGEYGTDQRFEQYPREDGTTGWRTATYDYEDMVDEKDVSGIVNFYTKRLVNDIKKLFKNFEGTTPYLRPKEEAKPADLDLENLFPTPQDFDIALQELVNYQRGGDPFMEKAYKKALQVARNQRVFDAQAALDKAGVPLGRLADDMKEVFPQLEEEMGNTDPSLDAAGNANVDRWMMDVTPELKATATGEGFSMFSSVQREAPDTPEFRQWFKGSKVVGDDGKPLTVYHGTLKDFDRFGGHGRVDAAAGAGFYFTNEADDASYNYADPNGPDQIYKMQRATDELLNNEDVDVDDEGIADEVRAQMQEHGGSVIPVYLAIQNPVVLDGPNSSKLGVAEFEKMKQAIHVISDDFLNVDPRYVTADLSDLQSDKQTNAEMVLRRLEANRGLMDAIDPESGMEAQREVIRRMWEMAGFDGIIMKGIKRRWPLFDNLTDGTTHYIAFHPEQIKSVNNTGSYDPKDVRFMYSSVQPQYSATGTMGQRVPQQAPADRLAAVEAKITYNNIAPWLERLLGKVRVSQPKAQSIAEGTVIALQDKMQPLAKLIDRVRKNGGMISNETDTYLRDQLMAGKVDIAIENNKKSLYDPIVAAVQKLDVSKSDVDELLKRHPSHVITLNGVQRETSAVQNILNNYADPKMGMAELYLYAQHAKERNALMRERNAGLINQRPEQFDSGSGMSDFEANDVLAFIGSKPYASQFSDLSNKNSIRSLYRKLISNTNDVRVDGGLNPDFRKMFDAQGNKIDRYQDYAPLRGFVDANPDHAHDDLTNEFARVGKGLKITGKEDKSATGRVSEASNLIANAILQNEEAIIRAEKNKVGQTFLNMLKANMGMTIPGPNGLPNTLSDFAEIVPLTQQKPVYDRKSGVVRMQNHSVRQDPDMMVVKVGGTETGIKLKDPKLRAAFLEGSTLGNQGQTSLIKGLLKLNRFLAAVRTSYNPEFMLSNFFRDLEAAVLNLSELEMRGLRSNVAKDALPAIRGVYRSLRDGKSDPWRTEFEEFAARGGKTAFMGLRDLEGTIDRIMKDLQTDPNGNFEQIKNKAKSLAELINASNDAVENGVRVATYKHLKDRLIAMSKNPNDPATIERAKNRAAFAAKNLTVNFNMGGTLKPTMNAWYLFFNASLQGSAALANPLIRSKKVRQFWLAAIAAGALQDIVLSALSPVGDDGEKEYDKIPEQVLQTNMILFNPLSERGYIKIPMPYLFNAAWNAGRATMRGIRGGYTMGETINSVMGTAAESLNPWGGGGSWLNFVAPTVLDPAVELVANKNFMGAPIQPPESPYGVGDIPSQRYWNNTSPAYVGVAQMLDMVSGGDGVFPGAASFSPNQYEYAFEFLGGGAMSTILRAWDFLAPEAVGGAGRGMKLASGEKDVSANDIPFLRRFVGNITTREDLSGYIDKRDDVLTVRNALRDAMKDGDVEKYQQIMQDYPKEYRLAAKVNQIETRRKKIGAQIKKIMDTKRLSDKDKKKLIEPLRKSQEELVNQANAYMNGV